MPRTQAQTIILPKGAGSQHVYETIRRWILSLDFPPGMQLEEAKLVKLLNVSRTPVREALIRLGSEGLVRLSSNRSASVAPLNLADLRQYFEALDLAQRAVTRWAAERRPPGRLEEVRRHVEAFEAGVVRRDSDAMMEANRDLHVAIAAAADNQFMREVCIRLYNQGLRVSRMAVTYDFDRDYSLSDHLDRIIGDHRRFVELIEAGDADAAEALAGTHAELARRRVVEAIARLPSRPQQAAATR